MDRRMRETRKFIISKLCGRLVAYETWQPVAKKAEVLGATWANYRGKALADWRQLRRREDGGKDARLQSR